MGCMAQHGSRKNDRGAIRQRERGREEDNLCCVWVGWGQPVEII